jgi:hypothetical protein
LIVLSRANPRRRTRGAEHLDHRQHGGWIERVNREATLRMEHIACNLIDVERGRAAGKISGSIKA